MKGLTDYVLAPLTFIGAINGGLVGTFGYDLAAWLFGPAPTQYRLCDNRCCCGCMVDIDVYRPSNALG